jgi:putative ABC transport system ATP-binding protein
MQADAVATTPPARAPVFIARRLCKVYRMGEVEVHALRDVDLEIHDGEFIVLLGPSGSDHVGFVFQFYNLIPSLTVRENVQLVTDIAPRPMRAEEAIELVDLSTRADHFPSQLSGGEQQRVAIARAVAKRPDVLLCDEPTGALDYATGKLVLEVIARVNAQLGTTAVVITHNAAIAGMADRVLHLADGRIDRATSNARRLSPAEPSW